MINITEYPKLHKLKQTNANVSIPAGWYALVEELLQTIDSIVKDYGLPKINYLQIKQKFTSLRVYFSYDRNEQPYVSTPFKQEGLDMINDLVDLYEGFSIKTCTLTGKPGKQVNIGGFYTVLHESLFKVNKKNEQRYTAKGKALNEKLRGF